MVAIQFKGVLCFAVVCCVSGASIFQVERAESNEVYNRPIIGVLSQEVTGKMKENYGPHSSYIAASYVKHLESAGARVVPIWIDRDKPYYQRFLRHLNGVLLPGGDSWFNVTRGFAEAGTWIIEIADALNEEGAMFPLWGTCLGFELMGYVAAKAASNSEILSCCSSENQASPLDFKTDQSKLFSKASKKVIDILSSRNSTINYHSYCLKEEDMRVAGLLNQWTIISVSKDTKGLEFVSAMEHKTKPYYGVQFHPEKPAYEWKPGQQIPHDADSIWANQYFADFFVSQARRSQQRFPSEKSERQYLMYNYQPTMGIINSSFSQVYLFDDE